jgi:hypothetical protein
MANTYLRALETLDVNLAMSPLPRADGLVHSPVYGPDAGDPVSCGLSSVVVRQLLSGCPQTSTSSWGAGDYLANPVLSAAGGLSILTGLASRNR